MNNMALSEQRIRNNKIRRRRELRRHRRACALIMLLMILFLSTFFSLRTQAEGNNNDEALSKYYTSIQVKSGDTLWHYARQYGNRQYYKNSREYVDEIMMINSLRDDTIITGQYLILPYYRPSHERAGSPAGNSAYGNSISPAAGQL